MNKSNNPTPSNKVLFYKSLKTSLFLTIVITIINLIMLQEEMYAPDKIVKSVILIGLMLIILTLGHYYLLKRSNKKTD